MNQQSNQRQLDVTDVFHWNYNSNKRYRMNQGGTRSGKTYAILQVMVVLSTQVTGKTFAICRKWQTDLHQVKKDFQEIMTNLGFWNEDSRVGGAWLSGYKFNDNVFEFHGVDEQKVRGRKRDYLFINEANELSFDEFNQLRIRTTDIIFIDFNPSDPWTWLYQLIDEKVADGTGEFFRSTYRNNPYLTKEMIDDILSQKGDHFASFVEGERGATQLLVYKVASVYDSSKVQLDESKAIYGLDYGYADPNALVKVYIDADAKKLHVKQLLFRSNMTPSDLTYEMVKLGVDKNVQVWADSARPELTKELQRAGFRVDPAMKPPGSLVDGINIVNNFAIHVDKDSPELLLEIRNYKRQKKGDDPIEAPEDKHNHCMDALRYAVYMWWRKNKGRDASDIHRFTVTLKGDGWKSPTGSTNERPKLY